MNLWLKLTWLVSTVVAASGCITPISPISSHTLAVAENQEQDVVWIVIDNDAVYRCTQGKSGPVCQTAARQ